MLSLQQFSALSYQEKKQTLVDIFSQLLDTEKSFEETIFLLQASDQIKGTTLDAIYKQLGDLLEHTKDMSQQNYLDRLHTIQSQIYSDVEKESAEADSLLDTL